MKLDHQPYSNKEHWNAFWRTFCRMKRQNRIVEIPFSDDMLKKAERFTHEVIKEKRKERVHQRDGRNEYKRWMTGTLGELALEEFLGIKIHDPTIGHSSKYAIPDLSSLGIPVGVKSFRVGNFPLVNRITKIPFDLYREIESQIFVGIELKRKVAYLFGLGFPETLVANERNPESNRYVKDKNALDRKTAFIDLPALHVFQSLDELKNLVHDYYKLTA